MCFLKYSYKPTGLKCETVGLVELDCVGTQ